MSIELHPIGGYCCVGTALPPSSGAGRTHMTQAVRARGSLELGSGLDLNLTLTVALTLTLALH